MTVSIEQQLRDHITQNILYSADGSYAYGDDTSFLEAGVVDSSSVLELVLFVEENFGFSVEDSEVLPENFDSITRLSAYIRRKMQNS